MRIIVDIMSGDRAPREQLLGVCRAARESYAKEVDFTLVGNEEIIRQLAKENKLDISKFEIKNTTEVLTM